MDYQAGLTNFIPEKDFFVGIDSDGCVFDSMEVKQKEFFIPNALKYFDLFPISKILRETWEFVNLYSIHRGGNRFTSIIKVFELLAERKEIRDSGYKLPNITVLKKWVDCETRLGNTALRNYYELNYDPNLGKVVKWTEAVNDDINKWLRNIPAFPYSITAIQEMYFFADLVVVSQTPLDALNREWEEHNLKKFIGIVAGQEHGTKTEHITLAAKGKYADNKILMVGDAPGDLNAAKNNGVLFFPIIPGRENESWKKLIEEGLAKFKSLEFKGEYEKSLLKEFSHSLPDLPPWNS